MIREESNGVVGEILAARKIDHLKVWTVCPKSFDAKVIYPTVPVELDFLQVLASLAEHHYCFVTNVSAPVKIQFLQVCKNTAKYF